MLNVALSFLLEVACLTSVGYWMYSLGSGWFKWVLAVGGPLLLALFWGVFLAPESEYRLGMTAGVLLSTALFLFAAAALHWRGQTRLALVFAVVIILNRLLLVLWKQW